MQLYLKKTRDNFRRTFQGDQEVIGTFIFWLLGLFIIGFWISRKLPCCGFLPDPPPYEFNKLLQLFGRYNRWDAVHYINIAENGYHDILWNFFPLYPFLLRVWSFTTAKFLFFSPKLAGLISHPAFGGVVISTFAFASALFYLKKFVTLLKGEQIANKAVIYLVLYPFFFLCDYLYRIFVFIS